MAEPYKKRKKKPQTTKPQPTNNYNNKRAQILRKNKRRGQMEQTLGFLCHWNDIIFVISSIKTF